MVVARRQPLPTLTLADGTHWHLEAGDPGAVEVVARLAAVMRLKAQAGDDRRLLVLSSAPGPGADPPDDAPGTAVCVLDPDHAGSSAEQFAHVAGTIVRQVQRRGGVLLHGALAQRDGEGVVLAAPPDGGKSTASRRLPPPWRSLCDDATLLVRDDRGRYWAHPWPTWSRFLPEGPGGDWPVACAVPLRAMFFLVPALGDEVRPVGRGHAAALLFESAFQATRGPAAGETRTAIRDEEQERFANVCALARTQPCYLLQLTLTGAFWTLIDRTLAGESQP